MDFNLFAIFKSFKKLLNILGAYVLGITLFSLARYDFAAYT